MVNRAADWFRQAERGLAHAAHSRDAGTHEWACFAAHQAAKKAVKALHFYHGADAWGRVIHRLLAQLPEEARPPSGLVETGRVLDTYYVPTRYPDALTDGAPFEFYGPLQSEEAVRHAGAIIEFVRAALAQA